MATVSPQTDTRILGRIFATTVDRYLRQVWSSAYGSFATWGTLMRQPGVRGSHMGGQRVQVPLELTSPERADAVPAYGTFDTTPANVRTAGLISLSQYISAITIDNFEQIQHRPPEAIAPLLRLETESSRNDLMDRLNKDMWLDASANANRIIGFASMISTTPGTGTYLGVSRLNNTNWRNIAVDNANDTNAILEDYRTAMTNATSGQDMPTLIFMGRTARDVLESKMTVTLRVDPLVIAKGGPGDASINDLMFRGARVVVDEDTQDYGGGTNQCAVLLNPRYLKMDVANGQDFTTLDFVRPSNQNVLVGGIKWCGVFYCTQLRRQAVHYGQAAA